jgi:hypothetical protein
VPESIDPGDYRVSTLGRLFALAAFHHRAHSLDKATLDRIVDRAIALFAAGDLHAARALFYLATPDHVTAARALDALGVPPRRRRRPLTGPPPEPDPGTDPAGDRTPYGDGLARLLAPPLTAQVLLWEDARRDPDGRLTGVYVPVPVVWPPGLCRHLDTICPQCLDTWAEDHALALFAHGPQGAAAGCLCPTCRPEHCAPSQPPSSPGPDPHRAFGGRATASPGPTVGDSTGGFPPAAGAGDAGGGWYTRQIAAAGHTVDLSVDPVTGLTAVSYPDRPPPRLSTGPHLAVLAAVADALELVLALTAQAAAQPGPGRREGVWG